MIPTRSSRAAAMPNLNLTDDQRRDIVDYLETLK